MVWDTIHARDVGRDQPIQEWGGIAYALAAADAALGGEWTVFPIIKIGRDLRPRAEEFLRTLPSIDGLDGVRTVEEPNNRVELFYHEIGRRCERLTGGVPGWEADEIRLVARSCDALYVNFIAGWELGLPAAAGLRAATRGPVYCDLHSLMLGVGPDGVRSLKPLADWRAWLRCFDAVQLNEDELTTLAEGWDDPWALAAEVVGPAPGAVFVTLADRGAAWVATRAFWERPLDSVIGGALQTAGGPLVSGRVPAERHVEQPDPTGCGDVWGATCFAALLSGAPLEEAMRRANGAAARNAAYRGATGLSEHLRSSTGLVTGDGSSARRGATQ
jgi:sugar/nucleoside kinase (ribokinase family)